MSGRRLIFSLLRDDQLKTLLEKSKSSKLKGLALQNELPHGPHFGPHG